MTSVIVIASATAATTKARISISPAAEPAPTMTAADVATDKTLFTTFLAIFNDFLPALYCFLCFFSAPAAKNIAYKTICRAKNTVTTMFAAVQPSR